MASISYHCEQLCTILFGRLRLLTGSKVFQFHPGFPNVSNWSISAFVGRYHTIPLTVDAISQSAKSSAKVGILTRRGASDASTRVYSRVVFRSIIIVSGIVPVAEYRRVRSVLSIVNRRVPRSIRTSFNNKYRISLATELYRCSVNSVPLAVVPVYLPCLRP